MNQVVMIKDVMINEEQYKLGINKHPEGSYQVLLFPRFTQHVQYKKTFGNLKDIKEGLQNWIIRMHNQRNTVDEEEKFFNELNEWDGVITVE